MKKVPAMLRTALPVHVIASVQSHPLSTDRVIFLAVLVAFFSVLFVVSYVIMRRPDFGQHGNDRPAVERTTQHD
jgi:hypothetical protein